MNLTTFSPALVMMFVVALLWILMDVKHLQVKQAKRTGAVIFFAILAIANHLLRSWLGASAYGKLIFLTLHMPTFLVFFYLTRCGVMKMIFMILTALVFTAPTIIIGNIVRRSLFVGSSWALLISNLAGYGLILLLAYFVFREVFHYFLKYGDNRLFAIFSLVPLLYYVYVFCVADADLAVLDPGISFVTRFLPTVEVFVFYFLLLYAYKRISTQKDMEVTQTAMKQKLAAAEERIRLMSQAQTQTAVYQHDLRHHLTMLEGFLSTRMYQQAEEYIRKVQSDVEAVSLKRFCENETVNLLCSAFAARAEKEGIRLDVEAKLPQNLQISDMELCSVISNGLENALQAAALLRKERWVSLYCGVRKNKLLIEIKNPYTGKVILRDGIPVSDYQGHGFGCRSILLVTGRYKGVCDFSPEDGIFTLRVVLPHLE